MTSRIEIRFASLGDERRISDFLRDHWRADHIFVTNPEVMRWQHASSEGAGKDFTFVIADRLEDGNAPEMLAVLGFIPFTRFDDKADWTELALAIWKVRDDAGAPGLGLQLLRTIERTLSPALICAIGTSQIVKPIYKALRYKVDALSHVALFLEEEAAPSTIALNVPAAARQPLVDDSATVLIPVVGESLPPAFTESDIDAMAAAGLPRKSWSYVLNRYVRHPWSRYEIRAAVTDGKLRALFVWRRVPALGGSILRIVDIIGDSSALASCGAALRREVQMAGCEYIDLMHFGVAKEDIAAAGFVGPEDYQDLILPNYFEPFEQRNVRIEIAYRVDPAFADRVPCLFRADSDQDRPNQPGALVAGSTAG